MTRGATLDLRPSEARILEVVRASPGIMARECADRAGVAFNTYTHAILVLRAVGLVSPSPVLVPSEAIDVSRLSSRQRAVLAAICDGIDTADALHEQGITATRTTANRLTLELRRHGALEPASGLYAGDEVTRRHDAAWDALVAAERAA